MEFVLLSADGSGIPIALRLQREGFNVFYAVKPKPDDKETMNAVLETGDGLLAHKKPFSIASNLIKKANSLRDKVIVIFDMNHNPELADKLRKAGYMVIGSGTVFEKLEDDRKFGLQTMKQCGISIPESYEFKKIDKAKNFLSSQPSKKAWVFKPDAEEAWATFPADTNDELINYMDSYKSKIEKPFILQEKIKGIEVSVEGWFNGDSFVFWDATLERKKISAGDIGRNCGCAGDVVWRLQGTERVITEGLFKVEPLLKHIGIPCMIDLNQIVNNKGLWAIEWTPRFGYNASLTLFSLLQEKLGDVFARLASRQFIDMQVPFEVFGSSVRIGRDIIKADIPIRFPEDKIDNIWLWDAKMTPQGMETAGSGEEIMTVTGQGKTIQESVANCYGLVKQVVMPDADYRVDIGQKALDDYNNLQQLGWI